MVQFEGEEWRPIRYGGFWIRLGAFVIDFVLLNSVIAFLIMAFVVKASQVTISIDERSFIAQIFFPPFPLFCFPLPWLYFTLLESSKWQATIGKKLLSLKVVDDRGRRIGFGRANGRYWAKILSAFILYFGFFMIGWTRYKQGLHDLIASTYVVRD